MRHTADTCSAYGAKTHLSNALTFINYRADLFLVNVFLTSSSAGLYAVATQLGERMWIVSEAVSTVLLPRLSHLHADEGKRRRLTPTASAWTLLISTGLSLLLAVVAKPVIALLFGTNYLPAVTALIWMLPGIVLGSLARVLANDIAARGRPELNLYVAAVVAMGNVLLNILLIPQFGIVGAAMSTSIAYSFNAMTKVWLFARLSGTPWWRGVVVRKSDLALIRRGLTLRRLE